MKKIYLIIILYFIASISFAQTITNQYYNVSPDVGYGIRFWSSDAYKIHMGNSAEYLYGSITDYSIKTSMSNHAGRGWTWGVYGQTPIASLTNLGKLQIASDFISLGKVGIGTSSMNAALDVISSGGGTAWFRAPHYGAQISHIHYGSTGDWYIRSASTAGKIILQDAGGNVGIGTMNPGVKLDVVGGGRFSENLHTDGHISTKRTNTIHANRGKLNFSHVLTDFNHTIYNNFDNIDGEGIWDGMKFNVFNGAWFRTGNHSSFTTALFIDQNGKIGINTKNPGTDHLSVNGTIKAKEVKVTLDGWSDFVFEEDYKLMPLLEVENYIKINKHLPEIPSAKEVEENGVNLGTMEAKLLQKIEELTLYVIEQSKQIDNLKKEIDALHVNK